MDIPVTFWYESALLPVLTVMTLLPLATLLAILIIDTPKANVMLAFGGSILIGLLSSYLLLVYDTAISGIQLVEHIQFFGLSYFVGVDGANILFIPLTAVLTLLTLIYLQTTRYASDGEVLAGILGYTTILIGAFAALNALQFWLWSFLELVPVIFLTLRTGTGQHRQHAVKVLLQFWGGGLLLTLIGFLLLGSGIDIPDEPVNYDWLTLAQNEAPFSNETLIFILLMYGFAIRMPLFPFHAWLPLLAEQGTVASSAVFIVGLKLGIYAVIRFVFPLLPGEAEAWSGLLVTLSLLSIFYGAILALMQLNMRRLLAFAAISHSGVLVLGIFSFEVSGVEGSLLLSLAYGLAMTGLLLSIGFIYEHTQTAYISRLGGLFDRHIAISLLFLVSALSTMAMPGTPGFNAAHMVIEGVVEKNGWVIALLIGIGNLLIAAFLLWAFQRLFLTDSSRTLKIKQHSKTAQHEWLVTLIISSLLVATGFYSVPWKSFIDTAKDTIGTYYNLHNMRYDEPDATRYDLPDSNLPPLDETEEITPFFDENTVDQENNGRE